MELSFHQMELLCIATQQALWSGNNASGNANNLNSENETKIQQVVINTATEKLLYSSQTLPLASQRRFMFGS
ncbi:hypothetical protein V6N11_062540 [Hibiscus sabdariffa]|uniref:Uncharacterized protein n=1 Tax=Hibiscus sabdariffa TaxID=183260 RepID=A0ABR2PTB6_9ROSI